MGKEVEFQLKWELLRLSPSLQGCNSQFVELAVFSVSVIFFAYSTQITLLHRNALNWMWSKHEEKWSWAVVSAVCDSAAGICHSINYQSLFVSCDCKKTWWLENLAYRCEAIKPTTFCPSEQHRTNLSFLLYKISILLVVLPLDVLFGPVTKFIEENCR